VASVGQQVRSADSAICQNIERYADDRVFLSQNLLGQLRNLVEGLVVWAHLGDPDTEFHYDRMGPALEAVKAIP
jgi:hypothetical protein